MSEATRLALIISAVVIFILGMGSYIALNIIGKKMRQKMLKKSQEEAMIQIQALRNDIGELPFQMKDYLKSKANDIDVEGIINTVFRNDYKNVMIVSHNDLFPNVAVAQKTKAQNYVYAKETKLEKLEDLKRQFPEEFPKNIQLHVDEPLDLLVIMNAQGDINDIYDDLSKKVHNGMILVSYDNPRGEIKRLISYLKLMNLTHEISYISSKYLFIVKK
ncbi:BC85_0335 family putative methyltransferase [Mycoplasma seminis]|uniref:Uncharacterized protein n=1 Tax=Mycoplasma seminis TaxID=512749 RepID=A0ABY9HD69_9MOLU|nr:hypothetical protein [Mycoplasma seminis]WLP85623.1 hypothetical protein Q8852_00460 [Mycoplasma seminis]